MALPAASSPRREAGLLLLCSIGVYLYTLGCGFVYDDVALTVLENPALTGEASAWDVLGWDRPLREFTYMLDHALWGFSPAGYHLQNLLWHGANTLLLFAFLRLLGLASPLPFWTALLFALHPIQTEAVAWVSGRKELLCLFFELLACFLYLRALARPVFDRKAAVLYAGCSLALLLALLSKQVAAAAPLLLFGSAWLFARLHHLPLDWKRQGRFLLGPLALTSFFILYQYGLFERLELMQDRGTYYDPAAREVSYTPLSAVLTPLAVFGQSLWLSLWPLDLTIERGFAPVVAWADLRWLAGLLGAALWSGIAWACRARQPAIAFGLFWWLAAWAPVSGVLPVAYLMADRYLYIPTLGFALAGVALLHQLPLDRQKITLLLLGLSAAFAIRTLDRGMDWKDEFTLWNAQIAARPALPQGYINLGNAHLARGEVDQAISYWQKALERQPNAPQVWLNWGNAEQQRGNPSLAEAHYRKALELLPDYGLAHYNLGLLLAEKGQISEAIAELEKAATQIYGKHAMRRRQGLAHYHLARLLFGQGEAAKATSHLIRAEHLYPRHAPTYLLKGSLAQSPQAAREAFLTAIYLEPTYSEAYFNLGVLEWRTGNHQDAQRAWDKAVALNPALAEQIAALRKEK